MLLEDGPEAATEVATVGERLTPIWRVPNVFCTKPLIPPTPGVRRPRRRSRSLGE